MQIVIIPYRHPKGHSLDTNSFSKVFIPHDHKFNTNLIQYEFSSPFKFHIKVNIHQNHSYVGIPNMFLKIFTKDSDRIWISQEFLVSYILRRPLSFATSLLYFWLALHRTKVRWRFRKILRPSQNIWTLSCNLISFHL